ncbi:uncharacterized protein LOC111362907 [Spodoptera litura]|uniref:Uncharacterized protein LOC111362907 n=1 Tax=Spodoptera litura TaxID=69820 RepID=A0A9J7IZN7_SPOLT|nr:uncharacterized protein LOC111362907 [Spodoptera litura]
MSKEMSQERHDELYDRLAISKHVINEIKNGGNPIPNDLNEQLTDAVCQYTGVKEETVKEALNYNKKKTFTDLYIFSEESLHCFFNPSACFLRFEDVRQIIFDLYVNQLQIPNKNSIFQSLVKLERYKDYFVSNLETDMYYIGFIWRRLPNSKKYIVVEKSAQFMRRMKYLQRMNEYRSNNRVLVHVEKSSIKLNNLPASFEIMLAVCPQLGLIDLTLVTQTMENWLKTIIHGIPSNSVFVIQLPPATEETIDCNPKINSPKKDLIKWLESYGIPHDPNQHSAELYALITKYKCFYPCGYKFIAFLEAAGHEVVVRPSELNDRYFDLSSVSLDNFFSSSSKKVSQSVKKSSVQTTIQRKFSEYSLLKWLKEDRKLADREMQIYEEDQKLELVLDNLMDKINDGCMSEADFDECDGKECDLSIYDRLLMPKKTYK